MELAESIFNYLEVRRQHRNAKRKLEEARRKLEIAMEFESAILTKGMLIIRKSDGWFDIKQVRAM